jgi:hypothetical protein
MKTAIPGVLLFILSLGIRSTLAGQNLWPGDVNNNGIVNGVDLLYLGYAFGQTGPAREHSNTEWEAQLIPALWDGEFPDGTNFAYADCNGDGVVDVVDFEMAIEKNYGLTHGMLQSDGYSNGLPGIDPPLLLSPSLEAAEPGTIMDIALDLGTEALPVDDFYGIAMTFSYTGNLLDDGGDVNFEDERNGWANPEGRPEAQVLLVADKNTGRGELAITRTDQQPIQEGAGYLGRFAIIIEDIIVGLEEERLEFRIDSVRLVDHMLNTVAIVPDTTSILIVPDTSLVTDVDVLEVPRLYAFPNPARRAIHIQSDRPVEWVKLYDLTGRQVDINVRHLSGAALSIYPSRPLNGIYLLKVHCGESIKTMKISFIQD